MTTAIEQSAVHMFPDAICNHPGCTAVFDSRTKIWANGPVDNRALIEGRDQWRFEPCPKHRTLCAN